MSGAINGPDVWLDPSRCAVVVIDVQNDFCHDDGAVARFGHDVDPVRAMMPGIHGLLELARAVDVPRILVRVEHSHWTDTPAWLQRGRSGAAMDAPRQPIAAAGTWGADFFEIAPQEDELELVKHRYSAFAHTPLELVLRAKGCSTVVLAGVVSHQCVEATARDAINHDVLPVVVREAVGARDDRMHQAFLEDAAAHLGPVVELEALTRAWVPDRVATGVG